MLAVPFQVYPLQFRCPKNIYLACKSTVIYTSTFIAIAVVAIIPTIIIRATLNHSLFYRHHLSIELFPFAIGNKRGISIDSTLYLSETILFLPFSSSKMTFYGGFLRPWGDLELFYNYWLNTLAP